jgi:hypothetical protein
LVPRVRKRRAINTNVNVRSRDTPVSRLPSPVSRLYGQCSRSQTVPRGYARLAQQYEMHWLFGLQEGRDCQAESDMGVFTLP